MNDRRPDHVFVYGTLKRGQCRANLWPRAPRWIQTATTLGQLIDLQDYPAMIHGDDLVVGELWCLAPEDLEHTLKVLDAVEGHVPNDPGSLYRREIVSCVLENGDVILAWTYVFAQPISGPAMRPDDQGKVSWPSVSSRRSR